MEEATTEENIEALMEDMDFIPGHFSMVLNLNCEPQGPAELRQHDTLVKRESLRAELEGESGRLQYAIRNLLGLLDFHLDHLAEAEEAFRSICREEPGNLNAWANLGCVYDRLEREEDEGVCVERVSALMGEESGDSGQGETRLRAARCLAEQAYAYPYDIELHQEDDLRERLITACTLYNKALNHGGDLIPTEEKMSWYFQMSTIYIRLDEMMRDKAEVDYSRLPHFSKALKLLAETLKSDKVHLKALAWCYVGLMLERKEEFSTVPMAIHDCGFSGSEPLACYALAIDLATDNAFVLNQLAKVFYQLGKHDMVMGICNMALTVLPDAELNWQAYCTRAKINVTTYMRDLENAKLGHTSIPDRQNLREARADLERVLSVRPCLRTHLEMAQVHYYMGVDALQESLLVDEAAVNRALVSLALAMQCEMGSTLPELQLLRGRCLLLKGEEWNAVNCFRRALKLQRPGTCDPTALRNLLEGLLACYSQNRQDPEAAIGLLEECVRQAEERYPARAVREELRGLSRSHRAEVRELSLTLVKRGRTELIRMLLESIQPRAKALLVKAHSV
ncbi:tetratricopeptide repeat protein 22-like [Denticeps clupeoides]|uniref:Tetratricopeptide repeat protein 22 n=1 Tax=Denticeps clupeoides TaxID=299321 RepID=A0AAY4EI15_9TELE|nr:tetratricopeptide repeat protein 22-like [Denticeps clupeoides]